MNLRLFTCLGLLSIATCFNIKAAEPSARIQIADFKGDKAGAVSYTFDDGLRNQYLLAAPVMERLQIPGTFFVIPGEVAASTPELEAKKPGAWGGVTWDEVRSLASKGFEIGNHGYTHQNLAKLTDKPDELEREIEYSADVIEKETGTFPVSFCYPYNSFNEQVESIVNRRHAVARTFQQGFGARDTTAESLNRWVDKLISQREWGVTMIHGLTDGFDPMRPEVFEAHMTYAKSRESDLWIDTFGNIGRYIMERNATDLEDVKAERNKVSFTPVCSLDTKRYNVPLTFIILTDSDISRATARQDKTTLPVTVTDGRIMVDCIPGAGRVTVKWK